MNDHSISVSLKLVVQVCVHKVGTKLADSLEGEGTLVVDVEGKPLPVESDGILVVDVVAEVVEEGGGSIRDPQQDAVDIREQVAEPYVPVLETNDELAPGYFVENRSRGWCNLWRIADTEEFDAGRSIYNETLGCNVILVTDKRMRLVDLITYATEDFQQYETNAAAKV